MAGRIFVNYRRDDSRADAARLRDRLAQAFGVENVFMDVDNLLAGQRFDKELEKALAQCDVFLAVIGTRWMGELAARERSGERDYVREEIAAALSRGTLVIPVLIERTALPRAGDLPEDIRALVLHQKHDVVHESFGRDMAALIEAIKAARKADRQGAGGGLAGVSAGRALGLAAAFALMATAFAMYAGWIPMLGIMGSDPAGLTQGSETEVRPSGQDGRANGEGNLGEARRMPSMDDTGAGAPPNAAITNGAPSNGKTATEPEAETVNAGTDPVAADAQRKAKEAAAANANRERIAMLEKSGAASQAEVDQSKAAASRPGDTFRDCPECPEMVVVPAGEFTMGSPAGEAGRSDDEGPQHKVTIGKPFAVGKFEVTFAEWDACVSVGGCEHRPSDNNWGRGRQPVIDISWDQIVRQYLPWLTQRTGKVYRLLSEAEWEYVSRAGTTTSYWWGEDAGSNRANCAGCGSKWDKKQTAPVGSFAPNTFGIYDTSGNVWELLEDCWSTGYGVTPVDDSASKLGDCSRHTIRGGSWYAGAGYARAAKRTSDPARYKNFNVGFRVARTLE